MTKPSLLTPPNSPKPPTFEPRSIRSPNVNLPNLTPTLLPTPPCHIWVTFPTWSQTPTFPRTITRKPPNLTTITHPITFGPRLKRESNVSLHPTPMFLRSPHMVPFLPPTLDHSSSPRGPHGSHSRHAFPRFPIPIHQLSIPHNPSPHSRSHPHDSLPYPTKSFSPNPYLHVRASSFRVALTYPHSLPINCHSPFAPHHHSNQSLTSLSSLFLPSHTQSHHSPLSSFVAPRFPYVSPPPTPQHSSPFYNSYVASKDIIPDTRFNLEEGEFPEIEQQIELRGWKRLTKPKQKVGQSIIREFYANARINEDIDEEQPHLQTFVRGEVVNFNMENIKAVLRLDEQLESDTNFRRRMILANQDPENVIQDLCVRGSIWELGARNNPLYLKRRDLRPLVRGWHEFIIHNILPTSNQSEITVKRAVLIHCIIHGQDVRVEKLIAEAMTKIVKNLHTARHPLAFPNVIARLCEAVGVSY
ncbi:hypothetical protein PIB30_078675 [Stylosanthes scabra]|uniref:Putative plant transposon protein domain-containing protein n=1 Tax=Stylosanthes scabra TaxID=79078 RepID=A0ABU6SRT5_9FABA|nr:hypothetical protein [Stylosanthes scabra]